MKVLIIVSIVLLIGALEVEEQNERQCITPGSGSMRVKGEKIESFQTEIVDPNDKLIDPSQFTPGKKKEEQAQQTQSETPKSSFLDSSWESEPVLEYEFDDQELEDTSEYGYGTWLRYLSTYPEKHIMEPDKFYFISRLTQNRVYYDFRKFGDRTLGIWLLRNVFIFATYDYESDNKNMDKNVIKLNSEIEGKWLFVQFSYSDSKKVAQAFVSRGTPETTQGLRIKCTHVPVFYLKLIVGGQHMQYLGFNGQFANLYYGIGKGLFIPSVNVLINHVFAKVSALPTMMAKATSKPLIQEPEQFSANDPQDKVLQTDDQEKMVEEYAVAGWFRWIPDILVKESTAFFIFNLRQNTQRGEGIAGVLGDRDLEGQFAFGGMEEGSVYFNTYTTLGNNGYLRLKIIGMKTICSNYVWTFMYFGYSTAELQAYGVLIQPGFTKEITHMDIVHKLAPRLSFLVGSEPKVPGFNGKMAFWSLFLGTGSFRKGFIFEYSFNFDAGAERLFQLETPITLSDKDESATASRQVAYDQAKFVDFPMVHDDTKMKINGQSEYGFGMWSRWLRTVPKYLARKSLQHMMGRVTTLKKYNDNDHLRDRTLVLFLGEGSYQFVTYDKASNTKNIIKQIDYKDYLEGKWNYQYFSYKRFNQQGKAVGHVIFHEDNDKGSVEIECLHYLVINYITFNMKNEFNIPLFNGYISKVVFRVGPGAYIPDSNRLAQWIEDSLRQPEMVRTVERKTIILIRNEEDLGKKQENETPENPTEEPQAAAQEASEEGEEIPELKQPDTSMVLKNNPSATKMSDSEEDPLTQEFNDFEGATEYALSGWVRWSSQEERTGLLHSIIRMSQKPQNEIVTGKDVGDQTLSLIRMDGSYRFLTYTCKNLENECRTDIQYDQPYFNYWDEWTYLYFGYSHNKQKCFGYVMFTFREAQLELTPVIHLYLSKFSIRIGADNKLKQYTMFMGLVKSWVLNIGEGAYQEGGFKGDETMTANYGLSTGYSHMKIDPVGWSPEKPGQQFECSADSKTIPLEVELKQTEQMRLAGVMEYGYGFWTRFIFYGKTTLINKPQWLGISRLTSNKQYRDMENFGDRILAIWMAKGFYHFATYNTDPPSLTVSANLPYPADSEGTWVYLYYSYKRFAESEGRAIAFAGIFQSISQIEINEQVVHNPLNDYLLFTVGHAGSNYKNFNGQITSVKLNLGPGAFIESKAELSEYQRGHFPQPPVPEYVSKTYTVKVDPQTQPDNDKRSQPIEYVDEFKDVPAYGIIVWFRQTDLGQSRSDTQVLFKLSQNVKSQVQDFQNPGDRALMGSLTSTGKVILSTYTSLDNDQFKSPLTFECQVSIEKSQLWTFLYFAYSHELEEITYYVEVENSKCLGSEHALHRTASYFALYLAGDGFNTNFRGKLAHTYLSFGDGIYMKENFGLQSGYVIGLKALTLSKQFIWDAHKEERVEASFNDQNPALKMIFQEGKFKIDAVSEYSHGYWCRYLTAIPSRVITRPPLMQISRITDKRENTNNKQLGDRILSIFLGAGVYQYSTYDTTTKNPSMSTTISYQLLEGTWTFLFMGYKRTEKKVICYALFTDQTNLQAEMTNVLHYPLGEFAQLILGGGGQGYSPFQGFITGLSLRLGPGAYVTDVKQLRSEVEMYYSYKMQGKIYSESEPTENKPQTVSQPFVEEDPEQDIEIVRSSEEEEDDAGVQEKQEVIEPDVVNDNVEAQQSYQESLPLQDRILVIDEIIKIQNKKKSMKAKNQLQQQSQHVEESKEKQGIIQKIVDKVETEIENVLENDNTEEQQEEESKQQLEQENAEQSKAETEEEPKPLDYETQQNSKAEFVTPVGEEENYQQLETNEEDIKDSTFEEEEATQVQTDQSIGVLVEGTKWKESKEYTVSGWFKWVKPSKEQECHSLFRFTNNEKQYRKDNAIIGDRTLMAMICPPSLRAYTYTMFDQKDLQGVSTLSFDSLMEEYLQTWNYIYMGYSDIEQTVHIYVQRPDKVDKMIHTNVKHIVPNYLALLIGYDTFLPRFHGYLQKWQMYLGEGAFLSIRKPDGLPGIGSVKLNVPSQWVINEDSDALIQSPQQPEVEITSVAKEAVITRTSGTRLKKNRSIDKRFTSEAEASLEYSIGMWTRWLQEFPVKLRKRASLHSLARLTTNRHYQDQIELGDRTLALFVAVERYIFSTYDTASENPNVQLSIGYQGNLEGEWNFLSFSFKRDLAQPEAVGYVYFTTSNRVDRISFKVSHLLLTGYARLVLAEQRFGYLPFNGWIFDPRVSFGGGSFVQTEQDLRDRILVQHRERPLLTCLYQVWKPSFRRLDSTIDQELAKSRSQLSTTFSDKQGALEYSVAIWFQLDVTLSLNQLGKMVLYRLSTTYEESLEDDSVAGDRTLFVMVDNTKLDLYTYNLNEPAFDRLKQTIEFKQNKFQWTFLYFGHSNALQSNFVFVQFPDRTDSFKQDQILHTIPNFFQFSLIEDSFNRMFMGRVQGVKALFGPQSFTYTPQDLINEWPYTPNQSQNLVFSVQLQSLSMNSAQIVRQTSNGELKIIEVIYPKDYVHSAVVPVEEDDISEEEICEDEPGLQEQQKTQNKKNKRFKKFKRNNRVEQILKGNSVKQQIKKFLEFSKNDDSEIIL